MEDILDIDSFNTIVISFAFCRYIKFKNINKRIYI